MKNFRVNTRTKIIIVVILLLASVTVSVFAQRHGNYFIIFNGYRKDVSNVINRNGRLYYPARELVDGLVTRNGATLGVSWNGHNQPFYIFYGGNSMGMTVGSPMVSIGNGMHYKQMSTVPFLHTDGRVYVPIRYVYEHFGWSVTFNETLRVPEVRSHDGIYLFTP